LDNKLPNTAGHGHSPSLAALFSFIWPGLGQLYLGKRRVAAIFALPAVLVLLLFASELRRGAVVFAVQLFAERTVGIGAIAIVILLGGWQLAAVVHAFASVKLGDTRRNFDRSVLAILLAIILISHVGAGYYLLTYSNAGSQVFSPSGTKLIDFETPSARLAPGQTPGPATASTITKPPPPGSRITFLFTGLDDDPSWNEHLYDSIMVVSYDPMANSVQIVSVPRDSAGFPLYYGGQVPITTRINALPNDVRNGLLKSPDGPYMTLVKEVSYLVGLPIDYYANVDLGGFVRMIDMVGGIDLVNPSVISDSSYGWMNGKPSGFYLAAGMQHLDGIDALAYVRSRHGSDNNDWKGASRQQQVLVELVHQMAQPGQILALPSLISTLGSSVATNFPANEVADYVAIGQSIPSQNITQVVLGPPTYTLTTVTKVSSATTSCLINASVAALSIQWFGKDSTWYGKATPVNTCPN
jgi:LCP family protein required for cell wall assembly